MRIAQKFIIAIVLLALLVFLLPASPANADEVVTFPDPNLEASIRKVIGKPAGEIYQSDLDGLRDLVAAGEGITDLTGLEHCTSLDKLALAINPISDISPLSDLTSLTWLWLSVMELSDISPLSNLTSLGRLELYNNHISDISPLSNLTSLTWLWLQRNGISDISPLSNLTSLENLDLSWNPISDIEPLVSNQGISEGDQVTLIGLTLNTVSVDTYIPALRARGVKVDYYDPSEGCFIATATYGNPMAEEIDVLRQFRDEYLLTNPVGQALVGLYYEISPPVADFIDEHPALKPIVRVGLAPAVALTTVAVSTTLVEKIAIAGALALVFVGLAVWLRRRARGRGSDSSQTILTSA